MSTSVICFAQDEINEEGYNEVLQEFDLSAFEEELDEESYNLLSELGLEDFDYNTIINFQYPIFCRKSKE